MRPAIHRAAHRPWIAAAICGLVSTGCHSRAAPVDAAIDPEATLEGEDCFVLAGTLPTRDNLLVRVEDARCGPLRLILAGPPETGDRLVIDSTRSILSWDGARAWRFPLALVNAGHDSFPVPIRLELDSANVVQWGRLVSSFHWREYLGLPPGDRRDFLSSWRFFFAPGDSLRALAPGERSAVKDFYVVPSGLTQAFRLAYDVRGARPRVLYEPGTHVLPRAETVDTMVAAVESLIREADFPDFRHRFRYPVLSDSASEIFGVSYGRPQDCPAGCVYSSAVGLRRADEAAWFALHHLDASPLDDRPAPVVDRIRSRWLEVGADDMTWARPFVDTLARHFGPYVSGVYSSFLRLVLESPHAPRELLLELTQSLYARPDQPLARMLVEAPAVRRDARLLTLLGNLPERGYLRVRHAARRALRELAPSIVRDEDASRMTLFVLAQALDPAMSRISMAAPDSLLLRTLADHPATRDEPATLAVLSEVDGRLRPRVLAAVDAPPAAKDLLRAHMDRELVDPDGSGTMESAGRFLLRDPATARNQDILAVLANLRSSRDVWVTHGATRRLTAEALRRWEPYYRPMH